MMLRCDHNPAPFEREGERVSLLARDGAPHCGASSGWNTSSVRSCYGWKNASSLIVFNASSSVSAAP